MTLSARIAAVADTIVEMSYWLARSFQDGMVAGVAVNEEENVDGQ